ncbi:hypothetical protein [Mycobacterium vicinigordonae]|uniref:DUF4386 domain-containing protein n=1 Tax=Mycobacterium vicinigordonae TaxID=1719132 RepID=A0A7D6E1F6_9MYCO|nr:hypothetical protein [Mycobacterium vicinigordonae]QLL08590.1 hypothetical protein H0P51_06570 [Mycobacterium vicinigordonae]
MIDNRWIRMGGVAGIGYVLIAVVAGALPGAPPEANGNPSTYQAYFIEHQQALVVQAWMYALAAPLWLIFAISVRRVLRSTADSGYLAELFFVGTGIVLGLLMVTQAMQIAVAQHAAALSADVAFLLGTHFGGVLIGLWGFLIATTAVAYAFSVFAYGGLPKWTGYLAVLTFLMDLVASTGVFFRTGPFCLEGGFSAWAPAVSLLFWYLGTSIALLRTPNYAEPKAAAGELRT